MFLLMARISLLFLLILILLMGCAPAVETSPEMEPTQAAAPTTKPAAEPSSFDDPFAYCAGVGTLDELDERYVGEEMPKGIIEGMIAEGIIAEDMPLTMQGNAVWRCMDQYVWVCHFGANLPCLEKADTEKIPNTEMEDYCQKDPNIAFIPAAVTGRATVYEWCCKDGAPEVVGQILEVDPQGYLAAFWYRLPDSE